jgi:hypothetical protein
LIAALVAVAVPAASQEPVDDQGPAAADSLAVSEPDTVLPATAELRALEAQLRARQAEREAEAASDTTAVAEALFYDCDNAPEGGVKANVTKVNYFAGLTNSVKVAGGGRISDNYNYSYDSYRRQDRTVENRSANVSYVSGEGDRSYDLLPVILRLEARTTWSEDITVNSAGRRNAKTNQTRRAGVTASRANLKTGPLINSLTAGWYYNNTRGENLGDASDRTDTETTGAVRTGIPLADGVSLATRIYGTKRSGDNFLAGIESPTETTGDTLGVGGYYKGDLLTGKVVFSQADFDRSFLDYRRNANGLVDTTNIPEGASKIVEELEEKDAWEIAWDNKLTHGDLTFETKMSHKYDKQQFNQSLVGAKEQQSDKVSLKLSFPVSRRDSLALAYDYGWEWDDQTFLDATESRGRQYKKSRKVTMEWMRRLFVDTDLKTRYITELSQDIAEDEFNQNDRDRLTEDLSIKIDSKLSPEFKTSLEGSYLRKDDVAIRNTLSANNNVKRTYEVSPQYTWNISERVDLQQTFRMYIQYQDYDFDELEGVRKEDTFNRRGNLSTKVTYRPNDRIEVIAEHVYNKKRNGTRVETDQAGRDTYRRDSDQVINRLEFALKWKTTDWLELQTATYRSRDEIERFSGDSSSINEDFSGELWLGGVIDRDFGPSTNPLQLSGRIKRFLAYGPNVTDTSDDYWEADLLVKWSF